MTQSTEQERAEALAEKHGATSYRNRADTQNPAYGFTPAQLTALIADVEQQAARRAPAVPETIEQRAKKLKGLHVLTGATVGVPEAIALARSRFVEAYGRSPLHDDLAYACLLIDAYGGAPQPPEADHIPDAGKMVEAPVQLPEPVGEVVHAPEYDDGLISWYIASPPSVGTKLYTEHQLSAILAQHGIKTK